MDRRPTGVFLYGLEISGGSRISCFAFVGYGPHLRTSSGTRVASQVRHFGQPNGEVEVASKPLANIHDGRQLPLVFRIPQSLQFLPDPPRAVRRQLRTLCPARVVGVAPLPEPGEQPKHSRRSSAAEYSCFSNADTLSREAPT